MRNPSNDLGLSGAAPGPRSSEHAAERGAKVTCPHCRTAAVWGSLDRINVLDGATLESHLTVRPAGWVVDVRACAGCGRSLARKSHALGMNGG
jgi:hypothetical protein